MNHNNLPPFLQKFLSKKKIYLYSGRKPNGMNLKLNVFEKSISQKKNSTNIRNGYSQLRDKIMELPNYLQQEMIPVLYPFFIHISLHFYSIFMFEEQNSFIRKYRTDFESKKQNEIDKINDNRKFFETMLFKFNLTDNGYYFLMETLNNIDCIIIKSIFEKYVKINIINNIVKKVESEISLGNDNVTIPNMGHITVYNCSPLVSNIKISKSLQLLAIPDNSSIYIHSLDENAYFPNNSNAFKITNHKAQIISSEFSPNSHFIASSSFDCDVRISDTEACREMFHFNYHHLPVLDVSFDDKGFFLSTASQDKTISLWNLTNSTILRHFVGHNQPVIKTVFSHQKKELYSISTDFTVKKWDIGHAKCISSLKLDCVNPTAFDIHPFNNIIACGNLKGSIIIYDLDQNKFRTYRTFYTRVSDVKFSADGKKLMSSSTNGAIRIIDWEHNISSNIINIPDSTIDSICLSKYSDLFVTLGKSTKCLESEKDY